MRIKLTVIFSAIMVFALSCRPQSGSMPVATVAEPSPTMTEQIATPTTISATPTTRLPATVSPPATDISPTETPVPSTATPAPTAIPAIPALVLQQFAAGFSEPVYLAAVPDGSGQLWVLERRGVISLVGDGSAALTVLDISARVGAKGQEQGLLGLAFHPNFARNGRLFLDYTNQDGDTVIAEFHMAADGTAVDAESEEILLTIPQPYANHNGGQLQFGPDGNLYIGMGDGGAANDPHGNGQNLSSLLGKILRISVDFGMPYTVPADNPFLGTPNARPEVWAYGLRNPWRFSFDRETGDVWIADVGQNKFEEVDFMPAEVSSGANYGWNIMEGQHCFKKKDCQTDGLVLPIAEYDHSAGCSITGGYVYRGSALPGLRGVYLYGDFCSGNIWGIRAEGAPQLLLDTNLNISSFGEDAAGELYVLDLKGSVFRVASDE